MRLTGIFLIGYLGLAAARPTSAQTTQLDPTFQVPQIRSGADIGTVRAIVQQADGKYVLGGSFSSINGVRARNLARLNADGTLDAAFTAACPANNTVNALAIQPNGSILVGGSFDSLAGGSPRALGRLLPSGALDAAFQAGLPSGNDITQVAVLPGGDVLALTPKGSVYGTTPLKGLYRLSGQTGQDDPAFQQAVQAWCFALQTDGRIVTGGGNGSYVLMHLLARLLPNGSLDPSYSPSTTYFTSQTHQVVLDAANNSYRLGDGNTLAGLSGPGILQNEWGSLNPQTFQRQPNGYFLVAGANANACTARLLPSGQRDASYQAAAGPLNGRVWQMLVQPNGAIMMAGSFAQAGATPAYGLVRMLVANVLATKNQQAENSTTAWPVPAITLLNVQLAAASHPQQVQLLDNLGRAVLAQAVGASTSALTLSIATLPAGVYALRVSYAEVSPIVRRVVVER